MLVQVRLAVALLAGFLFTGCDLLTDSTPRPWSGYAWHRDKNRLEYWFVTYETQRDCIEAMRYRVRNPPQNAWYSEPVDCAYHGNNWTDSQGPTQNERGPLLRLTVQGTRLSCLKKTLAPPIKRGIFFIEGQPGPRPSHRLIRKTAIPSGPPVCGGSRRAIQGPLSEPAEDNAP
jgi:hypothetical protein